MARYSYGGRELFSRKLMGRCGCTVRQKSCIWTRPASWRLLADSAKARVVCHHLLQILNLILYLSSGKLRWMPGCEFCLASRPADRLVKTSSLHLAFLILAKIFLPLTSYSIQLDHLSRFQPFGDPPTAKVVGHAFVLRLSRES